MCSHDNGSAVGVGEFDHVSTGLRQLRDHRPACAVNASPKIVGVMPRGPLSYRETPRMDSMSCRLRVATGWVTCRAAAAATTLPWL